MLEFFQQVLEFFFAGAIFFLDWVLDKFSVGSTEISAGARVFSVLLETFQRGCYTISEGVLVWETLLFWMCGGESSRCIWVQWGCGNKVTIRCTKLF